MQAYYHFLVIAHSVAGAASLLVFWLPIVSRKGSALHIRSGRWYCKAMYIVAVTAIALAFALIIDPIAVKYVGVNLSEQQLMDIRQSEQRSGLFLMSIALLVLASVHHGLLTLKYRHEVELMRRASHLLINGLLLLTALMLLAVAYSVTSILFYVFGGLGLATAIGNLRYSYQKNIDNKQWIIAHLRSMIAAGIASHTAFFVFGGSQLMSSFISEQWLLVPWLLPSVVGSIAISVTSGIYRKRVNVG